MKRERKEFQFVVELPWSVASEERKIFVPEFIMPESRETSRGRRIKTHVRQAHMQSRTMLRREIVEWLQHSVGKGNYTCGHPSSTPVRFTFIDKGKAALFKLFFA